jgi:hypothetical protein
MTQHTPDGTGQQLPPELAAMAATSQLGHYVSLFGPNRIPKRRAGAILMGALALGGVVMLFTVAWPLGLLVLAGCAYVAVYFVRSFSVTRSPRRIHLFAGGFIHANPPAAPTVHRWNDIAAVYQNITKHYRNSVYTHTTHHYIVEASGGRLALTDFWDRITVLGETIEREVTRAQLPSAVQSLRQGQAVRFGDLSVHTSGLMSERRGMLPWADIEKVQVRAGFIQVSKAGKWLSWSNTPVARIPNVFVFLALVEALHPASRR